MITDLPTERITVTDIFAEFLSTYKMAAEINWHRYRTKIRHCHLMYGRLHAQPGQLRCDVIVVSSSNSNLPVLRDRHLPVHRRSCIHNLSFQAQPTAHSIIDGHPPAF